MKGHENILALRRAGRKPAYVWVEDHAKVLLDDGLTVCVHGDTPELLDLRFLFGTTALVSSPSAERAHRLSAECAKYAKRVIATVIPGREVTQITDTDGKFVWPN
jgi:hypothetical protein